MLSCTPNPEAIEYGSDMCHYCKMTIVDQQHGSEVVTSKGKVYKFDAIECMIPYVKQNSDKEFAFILVNDYAQPSKLVDAKSSHYLVSEALPSPMGGFLTAFSQEQEAQKVREAKGGDLFTWNEITNQYN